MDKAQTARVSEVIKGFAFIVVGLFFGVLAFLSIQNRPDLSFAVAILLLVSVSSVEGGVFWIKKYLRLNIGADISRPGFWAKLAGTGVWVFFASNILGALAIVAIIYLFGRLYLESAGKNFSWENRHSWFLIALVIYAAVRPFAIRSIKPLLRKIERDNRKQLATYELSPDRVVLNIPGWPENKRYITIQFNELDDVRVLDRYQGTAWQEYGIGPDLKLGYDAIKDLIDYNTGKIDRPRYFSWMANVSGVKTLFLYGRGLTYLIGIAYPTGQDLIDAFENYQGMNKEP